jgi:hypothetical protein
VSVDRAQQISSVSLLRIIGNVECKNLESESDFLNVFPTRVLKTFNQLFLFESDSAFDNTPLLFSADLYR